MDQRAVSIATIETEESRRAVQLLQVDVRRKVALEQGGIPTFFDNLLLKDRNAIIHKYLGMPLLSRYIQFKNRDRFARYSNRASESRCWRSLPWEPMPAQLCASQGVDRCLTWRNLPLFKTVFDFALYPMLVFEIKPASIIELGTGPGGSALWFADLLSNFQIDGRVYSLDVRKPPLQDSRIVFIEGDGLEIELVGQRFGLTGLPHPWLVIEDMHINTLGVLRYFSAAALPGDYLIVEDSVGKQKDLAAFDQESGDKFRVDSRYMDFFGRNATCSKDSIFVKV